MPGEGELPDYPQDHLVGMVVPEGGSSCAKCSHVRNNNMDCAEPHFVGWNGGHRLPAPANKYCCDFYAIGRQSMREKYWGRK